MLEPVLDDDPREIGPFTLVGRLGAGSMGRVYLGRRTSGDGSDAAVKLVRVDLADDPEFRRRFRQEVDAVGRVRGPHTAALIGADTEAARPWLATEYLPGPSLRTVVAERGALPADEVLAIARGIARALVAIHAAGVVHRDLKPGNVILLPDGPRVIDFGIARAADSTSLTATGVTIGTPAYLAPEQVRGDPTGPAADVFALGGLLTYLATGRPPFGDGPTSTILYRITQDPPRLDGIDEPLRAIIAACLDKDPSRRPTPGHLAEPTAIPAPASLVAPVPRRGRVAVLAAAVLLLVAAVVVPLAWNSTTAGTPVADDRQTIPTTSNLPVGEGPALACDGAPNLVASGSSVSSDAVDTVLRAYTSACPGQSIQYTPNGSGAGIAQFTGSEVAMAIIDRPLTDAERDAANQRCADAKVVELPFVAHPIVLVYNIPGVVDLTLDADTLAKLFDGRITDWSDPAVKALNPDTTLPSLPVTVAYRGADSTITLAFQQYLAAEGDWPSGADTAFTGGVGTGHTTEEELRGAVSAASGGIGYATPIDIGSMTEASLGTVTPTLSGAAAAVDAALGDTGLAVPLADLYGAQDRDQEAYPLVLVSHAIVCDEYPDQQSTASVRDFLLSSLSAQGIATTYLLPAGEWASRLRAAVQ